jgi:hypothetical protein
MGKICKYTILVFLTFAISSCDKTFSFGGGGGGMQQQPNDNCWCAGAGDGLCKPRRDCGNIGGFCGATC